jgi:hypothetical protein
VKSEKQIVPTSSNRCLCLNECTLSTTCNSISSQWEQQVKAVFLNWRGQMVVLLK